MRSIRTRLLLTLAMAFILAWLALGLFIYAEARHETTELYDAELVRFAEIISSIPFKEESHKTQGHTNIESALQGHPYTLHISIQRWMDNQLSFHSQNIPEHRITKRNGYSDVELENEKWRFFQMETADNGLLVVGEKYLIRNEMIHRIAANTITPMIWTFPLLLFFLHIAISKCLNPLKTLSREVQKRDERALTPISTGQTPEEVKPLIKALNRLLIRLQEAFEKESQFTANASHELRTPLAGARSQAQLALRYSTAPETSRALKNTLEGLDRCDRMVEQMLTLHRLNPEQTGEHFEPVELKSLLTAVCDDLQLTANKKSIDLIQKLSASELQLTEGYGPGLYIMLKNIVENAINNTPDGGKVTVSLQAADPEQIQVDISDTGPGIPEKIKHQVFNRFFQQPCVNASGAGLGLSIVKHLADLHQAKLHLENLEANAGLRFSILFRKTHAPRI